MTHQNNKKCLEILKHYGVSSLLRKFAVECDKAREAALKYDYEANGITKQLLINELANVEIILQQVKLAIGYETINKEIDFKLNKQLREIELK